MNVHTNKIIMLARKKIKYIQTFIKTEFGLVWFSLV